MGGKLGATVRHLEVGYGGEKGAEEAGLAFGDHLSPPIVGRRKAKM